MEDTILFLFAVLLLFTIVFVFYYSNRKKQEQDKSGARTDVASIIAMFLI
jgi:CHASE3 domain sensor protein